MIKYLFVYNREPTGFYISRLLSSSLQTGAFCNSPKLILAKNHPTQSVTVFLMADTDRIVFPDEVDDIKEAAKSEVKAEGGDSNSVEETPATPAVTVRNMIVAPGNCPPGQQMGSDGVCREVFN